MTDQCTQTWRRWQPRAFTTTSVHNHITSQPRQIWTLLAQDPLSVSVSVYVFVAVSMSLSPQIRNRTLLTFDDISFPRSSDALVPSLFRPTMVCRYASTSTNELEKFPALICPSTTPPPIACHELGDCTICSATPKTSINSIDNDRLRQYRVASFMYTVQVQVHSSRTRR